MKGFAESDDLFPAVVETGQLHRILIGFRPRIAEEKLVVRPARYLAQLVRQLFLQGNMDRVGVKSYFVQLIGDALYIMRMGMPDRNNGMAAIEVQVLLPFLVPHV
jgi:hypothetical protein